MHQHGSQGSQWVQMSPSVSKLVQNGPRWDVCVSISKTVTSEIGFCTEFADISAVRAKLSIYPNTCALNAANHPPLNKCLNCLLLLKISSCDSILSLKVKQCYTSISDGVIRPNVHQVRWANVYICLCKGRHLPTAVDLISVKIQILVYKAQTSITLSSNFDRESHPGFPHFYL